MRGLPAAIVLIATGFDDTDFSFLVRCLETPAFFTRAGASQVPLLSNEVLDAKTQFRLDGPDTPALGLVKRRGSTVLEAPAKSLCGDRIRVFGYVWPEALGQNEFCLLEETNAGPEDGIMDHHTPQTCGGIGRRKTSTFMKK